MSDSDQGMDTGEHSNPTRKRSNSKSHSIQSTPIKKGATNDDIMNFLMAMKSSQDATNQIVTNLKTTVGKNSLEIDRVDQEVR